ncbi:MAG: sulfite exporter TauE/SafE family protein [Pseudomonadota bacterium]
MEYEFTALTLALVLAAGFAAGFINILAGGGGLLTLPALMLLGMPADVANGTMRVSVLTQAVEAVRGFDRHGQLDRGAVLPLMVPTVSGALAGSLLAIWIPVSVLKYVLLSAMIGMALLTLLAPNVIAPPAGTRALTLRESPAGFAAMFGCGIYGGLVQGGVGFLLIAALAGVLRYDVVRTNALKMVATGVFGAVSIGVFWWAGLIVWVPALVLAVATVAGAHAGVRYAMKVDPDTFRWILFVMVVVACVAAMLK